MCLPQGKRTSEASTMSASGSLDANFCAAVTAIDAGDLTALRACLEADPRLVRDRLTVPGAWLRDLVKGALDGFFREPYLLWFVAEDPVRNGRLPANIAAVAQTIIDSARRERADTLHEQLQYALLLVSWSWIARQCGVQLALLDVLVDAGASPDPGPTNALVNRNTAAAEHLVNRGARLTLPSAICLGRWNEATDLFDAADDPKKQFAFVLAALNGHAAALQWMIAAGVDPNRPSNDLYSHGTPLHHAVSSGSLDAVKVLVEAGASLTTADTAWRGTPLGWAEHYVADDQGTGSGKQYREIVEYLRAQQRC